MKPDNILVGHYAGSLAYGTNLPTSDVDIRGIFLDEQEGIWTPWSEPRMEEWEDESQEDTKYTELYKYMIGYVNGSPNVMETLWVDESSIISSSEAYEYLRSMAPKLLSKRLRYSFGGYALGQLKRIKGHNKWINNPKPEKPPVRPDYFKLIQNFQDEKIFARGFDIREYNEGHMLVPYGNDIYGVVASPEHTLFHYNEHIRKVDYSSIPDGLKKATPKFIVKLNEDVFKTDQEQHAQYWTWKKNRNDSRSKLEEQFGYDCYLESETEFLTNSGFKRYSEITENDLLGTVNPNSHAVEFQHFTDRVNKPFDGDIYRGENNDTAFSVTGNHRMYTSPGRIYSNEWKYVPMEDLTEGYHLRAVDNINGKSDISEECLMFIALYLKCGCIGYKKGAPSYISFASNNEIEFLEDHPEVKKYVYTRKGKDNKEYTYTYRDSDLIGFLLNDVGRHKADRRLPDFITSLSKEEANLLLDNMSYSEREFSRIYGSTNIDYCNDVQILALMAGKVSKIWSYKKHGSYQAYVSDKDMHSHMCNRHLRKDKASGNIVCFTVPNENLITRNNGKIAIQGNTKHAMHVVRLMRMCKEVLTDGVINVKRPDAEELLEIRGGKWKYEELLEWAEENDKELNKLVKKSDLPDKVDLNLAKEVLIKTEEIANASK